MKRIVAGAFLALFSLTLFSVVAPTTSGAAPKQDLSCLPDGGDDYPPTTSTNTLESLVLVSGQFNPGGRGQVNIEGAVTGDFYCGTAFSTPIALPTRQATAGGKLNYDVAVPADFELNAMHHIDMFKGSSQVGAFDFCVGTSGAIVQMSSCRKVSADGGDLPNTGTNHIWEIIRIALMLLAIAAVALYARRRVQASRTA